MVQVEMEALAAAVAAPTLVAPPDRAGLQLLGKEIMAAQAVQNHRLRFVAAVAAVLLLLVLLVAHLVTVEMELHLQSQVLA